MPLYEFRNTETGELVEEWVKLADYDQFILDNPKLERTYTKPPGIVDPIRSGRTKRHPALTDKLKALKKAHKGSNIDV